MTNSLYGKKILFFSPKFFDYEIEIKNKLREMGAIVDFYDERMNPSSITKIIIRLNKKIISNKIEKYYFGIINNIKNKKYDYVLFISPETITSKIMNNLKKVQNEAKFILYMYDSLKNKKNAVPLLKYFDSIFSFDKDDCQVNRNINFRPLFFLDDYSKTSVVDNFNYDLCFIGTGHSDRYRVAKKIENNLKKLEKKMYIYIYFPSIVLFLFKSFFDKVYKEFEKKDVGFKSLKKDEIIELYSKSKVVLDIQHPNQKGLTMRTIETIGSRKKLITTNSDISEYNFYRSENICVIDRNNPIIPMDFFQTDYIDIDETVYMEYSLGQWIREIFDL